MAAHDRDAEGGSVHPITDVVEAERMREAEQTVNLDTSLRRRGIRYAVKCQSKHVAIAAYAIAIIVIDSGEGRDLRCHPAVTR